MHGDGNSGYLHWEGTPLALPVERAESAPSPYSCGATITLSPWRDSW